METSLTKLLGIKYPVILGGMATISVGDLPGAVSKAGGLGVIGTGTMPPEQLQNEIRHTRAVTAQPFGVNIQMKHPDIDGVVDMVIREQVPVVTTGNGDPRPILERLRTNGIKVLPVVPNLRLAQRMEPLVDGIVLEGMEAGGHVGYSTTMALMSIILPKIKRVPVVAAGGIADGRGLAAALVMGAAGVQMGTAFLFTHECPIHENTKRALIAANDTSTIVTGHALGDGVRGLKNKFSLDFYYKETHGASAEELMAFGTGAYRRGMLEGDTENGSVSPGIVCAYFDALRPAAQVVASIISEAERALKTAAAYVPN